MKRSFFPLAFLLLTITSFGQEQKPPKHSEAFYLKKSKTQKKIANIIALTGTAAIITGIAYPRGEKNDLSFCFYICDRYENSEIKFNLVMSGIILFIPSITLYLASYRNGKKAERAVSLHLDNREIFLPQLAGGRQPTLSLQIAL